METGMIKITGVQARRTEKIEALDTMRMLISDISSDVLLFPEKWVTGEYTEEEVLSLLDSIDIDNIPFFIPGSFSVREGSSLYNRSYLFHYGKMVGHQDKISLFADEPIRYKAGSSIRVFSGDDLKIGIPVCYDIDFPYYSKVLMREGCNLILNPSLIRSNFVEEWHLYISARSLENRVPVVSVNSSSDPFEGNSIAVVPYRDGTGFRIRKTISHETIFEITIDPSEYEEGRERRYEEDPGTYSFPVVENIRF
ncbi:carbon-nitrogen hydrolase family protein [Thermoplasma sp.]|uniref:carbon-nitrogen hydrolase family protein n=1 Tax=Thermoplasma sp. TaxID=1973142 RepID=UPI0012808CE0|nr:carbon-nitrogen hydrolase family protein [Thermoplasma sp.]KAA8923134.1 MAG: carbon-nitrogen hydrolase family protein [Thermoplasma sp.]